MAIARPEIAALGGKSVPEIELCLNNALASLGTGSIREALIKTSLLKADQLIVLHGRPGDETTATAANDADASNTL